MRRVNFKKTGATMVIMIFVLSTLFANTYAAEPVYYPLGKYVGATSFAQTLAANPQTPEVLPWRYLGKPKTSATINDAVLLSTYSTSPYSGNWNTLVETKTPRLAYNTPNDSLLFANNGAQAIVQWVAPQTGTVKLYSEGNIRKSSTGGGDGVVAYIIKTDSTGSDTQLYTKTIAKADNVGYNYNLSTTVEQGDKISFVIDPGPGASTDGGYDDTLWNPVVEYTTTAWRTAYHASADWSNSAQGLNNWNYQYWDPAQSKFVDMEKVTLTGNWTDKSYTNTYVNFCILGSQGGAPGKMMVADDPNYGAAMDVSRTWTAPYSGYVALTSEGYVRKAQTNSGDGILAYIKREGDTENLWSKSIAYNDSTGFGYNIKTFVKAGQKLYFAVNAKTETSYDNFIWLPIVKYAESYSGSYDHSSIQGKNNWKYRYRISGAYYDYVSTYLTTGEWRTGYDPGTNAGGFCRITSIGGHPGTNEDNTLSCDPVRTWVAPHAGNITITSTAGIRLAATSGSDGIKAEINKNESEVLWSSGVIPIASPTPPTYYHTKITYVQKGDRINFCVNRNNNNSSDGFLWDPVVCYNDNTLINAVKDDGTTPIIRISDITDNVNIKAVVPNDYSSSNISASIIIAAFDTNGKLIKTHLAESENASIPNSNYAIVSAKLNMDGITPSVIKAFLWNCIDGTRPLTNYTFSLN